QRACAAVAVRCLVGGKRTAIVADGIERAPQRESEEGAIGGGGLRARERLAQPRDQALVERVRRLQAAEPRERQEAPRLERERPLVEQAGLIALSDRKSTRLNSSHRTISYAVFC